MKGPPFKQQPLGKRCLEGAVHCLTRQQYRIPAKARNGSGGFHGLVQQRIIGNHPRHKAGTFGLLRTHHPPRQDHIHGLCLANGARHPL